MRTRIAIIVIFLFVVLPIPVHAEFQVVLATVNRDSNLRSGPGTTYEIVGKAKAGDKVTLVDQSLDKKWYKLSTDQWIVGFLVTIEVAKGTPTKSPRFAPTQTPTPLPTSNPTNTPVPGLIKEIVGFGDSVEELPELDQASVLLISGNPNARHFSVTSYDENGNSIDLLVNTTNVYVGARPIGLFDDMPSLLEINAHGAWSIYVFEITAIRQISKGSISGEGDSLFAIMAPHGKTARIEGNESNQYFGVTSYGETGKQLLVNTTEIYKGTVLIGSGFMIVEVRASDEWTFTIK